MQAYEALLTVIKDKKIVKYIAYLSKFSHTGNLEVYHFSYEGMLMRSQLAILDRNTSTARSQAKTRKGDERFKLSYTKITGQFVAKPIKEMKDKNIFHDIVNRCVEVRGNKGKNPVAGKACDTKNHCTMRKA